MKKSLLFIAAALGLASASFAQTTIEPMSSGYYIDTKPFRFGAYVAPTISWMRSTSKTDDAKKYQITNDGSKVGFTYGIMAEYYFADNYAIVSGLQMNMGGGKMTIDRVATDSVTNTIDKAAMQYNINYLEIPLAIKLRTDPVSNFRFFGQAGLTLGINVGKKAAYTVDYYDNSGNFKTVTKEKDKLTTSGTIAASVAPILLSMQIGAGLEYPFTDKIAGYFGIFFNNGFVPDATYPNNFELYDASNNKIAVNNDFKDGNVRFNNFAFRFGIFF